MPSAPRKCKFVSGGGSFRKIALGIRSDSAWGPVYYSLFPRKSTRSPNSDMMAVDLMRALTKTLFLRQLQRSCTVRACSSSTQLEMAVTEPSKTSDASEEIFYRYEDYRHLLEKGPIKRNELWLMIRTLNRELRRGYVNWPRHLTPEQLLELIELPSWNKRRRFLRYYGGKEAKEFKRQNPKPRIVYNTSILKPWTSTDEIPKYGLNRNCLFRRLEDSYMYATLERLMIPHLPFGQKIALDFAYDHLMTSREINKLSIDVKEVYSANRWSSRPLNLHFCGFDPERGPSARLIQQRHLDGRNIVFPYEVSAKQVVELFPRENVVYLSPEGDGVLDEVDPDCVYVLGALVDKANQHGASARRARELGVRSVRFPANFFLRWEEHGEAKPLHLTDCVRILSRLVTGCSWEEAVRCVSKRISVEF